MIKRSTQKTQNITKAQGMAKQPEQARQYGGVKGVERVEVRRKQLINSGLMQFGSNGYSKTSIKNICEHAELTERYFYESFASKEELLIASYTTTIDNLKNKLVDIEILDLSPEERLSRSIHIFFGHLKNQPKHARVQLFEILGVSHAVAQAYGAAMGELSSYMKLMISQFKPDIDVARLDVTLLASVMCGSIVHIANQWVLSGFKQDMDELVPVLMKLILGSLNTIN